MWILLDRQTVRLIPFAPCAVVRTTAMTLADLRSHQQASNMVCDKCETKLGKLVVPDKWKDGARNVIGGKDGGAKVAASGPSLSKIAEKRKERREGAAPVSSRCKICRGLISLGYHYCNDCAYKKGICTMCGRKVMDTSKYKMSLK